MKAIIVFATMVSIAMSAVVPTEVFPEDDSANMRYFLVEKTPGVYEIENLVEGEIDARVSDSDLSYYYYSTNSPNSPTTFSISSVSSISTTDFNPSKDTYFIIHGWTNNYASPVNTQIRSALLPIYDANVFVVDWSPIAAKNYLSAQGSVLGVGNLVAAFISELVQGYGLQLSRVTLVGHSLGAHVAGNAGAALNGQVGVIVGLDPAGPLFSTSNTNNRIDPTDGLFVQVIHTNGGLLGMSAAIGDSDYYPNGGSRQPGCGIDLTGSCAHSRAYTYYAEAVASSTNSFAARLCDSYNNYSNGRCSSNARSTMAGYSIDTSASGNYYLDTNSASPYAQG
ncbi:hypothetical protein NQ318_021560 [Aromia moschata]|uniref:Lipase domain-containing protein n=1 Tax=Aromia moschata TaxID=1265417 RepID=A0AAV8YJN9_9CUCU|nr:hypothetical protein NQ318_021560 [Aromia moschata]